MKINTKLVQKVRFPYTWQPKKIHKKFRFKGNAKIFWGVCRPLIELHVDTLDLFIK